MKNHAFLDFEGYSSAGYHIREAVSRNSKVYKRFGGGLSDIASTKYAMDPSTFVLCLHYKLPHEEEPRGWHINMPDNSSLDPLLEFLEKGGVIEAFNSPFEMAVWNHAFRRQLDIPPLPPERWRDTAAKALAAGLPRGLARCGEAMGASEDMLKLDGGMALIRKFSIPATQRPLDPEYAEFKYPNWCTPWDLNTEDGQAYYQYNRQDVIANAWISNRISELNPQEQKLWFVDQRISHIRGIPIDVQGVQLLKSVVEVEHSRIKERLIELTTIEEAEQKTQEIQNKIDAIDRRLANPDQLDMFVTCEEVEAKLKQQKRGLKSEIDDLQPIQSINQNQRLKKFLNENGCDFESLTKDDISEAIKLGVGNEVAKEILSLREQGSKSSLKKLLAFENKECFARIYNELVFHRAHTGRWGGSGVQGQNIPARGPDVYKCSCGAYHSANRCFSCGREGTEKIPWNDYAADYALGLRSGRF